jgi:hypothetical protein
MFKKISEVVKALGRECPKKGSNGVKAIKVFLNVPEEKGESPGHNPRMFQKGSSEVKFRERL